MARWARRQRRWQALRSRPPRLLLSSRSRAEYVCVCFSSFLGPSPRNQTLETERWKQETNVRLRSWMCFVAFRLDLANWEQRFLFLAKFRQLASPHRAVQNLLVKSGDSWPSDSPYRNTIRYKASHHYNHVKGGNCKGVELVPLKVVGICFLVRQCQWLATSHPPPWRSPLHFLKLSSHLSLPYVTLYCYSCVFPFLSFLITYISVY